MPSILSAGAEDRETDLARWILFDSPLGAGGLGRLQSKRAFHGQALKPCQLPIVPKDPAKRKAPKLTRCPSQELDDCLVQTESGGDSKAVSPKGAKGKRQVMPIAIKELQMQSLIGETYDIDEAGLIYLKLLLTSCDTTTNAIAAYNGGVTAVNEAGGIPEFKETQEYVKKISSCLIKKGLKGGLEDANATKCCTSP